MSSSELVPVGDLDKAATKVGKEDAHHFILQVKNTVERCLAQGMDKAQMFRAIREEGLEPGAAFAVYKELRHQNRGFFEEYYCMIDLKEQRQRLDRLVHAFRSTGGDHDAEGDGAGVPETVTPLIAMEETDVPANVEWPDQQALHAWLSNGGDHQLDPAPWPHHQAVDIQAGEQVPNHGQPIANAVPGGVAWPHQQALNLPALEQLHNQQRTLTDGAFQGVAWPQQALHLQTAQQLHNHEETVANDGLQGLVWPQQEVNLQTGQAPYGHQQPAANGGFQMLTWPPEHLPGEQLHYNEQAVAANGLPSQTSAAGFPSEPMMNPWPLSYSGQTLGHGQQAGALEQWWRGGSASNSLPSSSLSQPPANQQY